MGQSYEIRVESHLDVSWSEWLGDLAITHQENGETLLTGYIADQAALHGLLNRLRDIGITLISVNPI
jgi:hypothetical protein